MKKKGVHKKAAPAKVKTKVKAKAKVKPKPLFEFEGDCVICYHHSRMLGVSREEYRKYCPGQHYPKAVKPVERVAEVDPGECGIRLPRPREPVPGIAAASGKTYRLVNAKWSTLKEWAEGYREEYADRRQRLSVLALVNLAYRELPYDRAKKAAARLKVLYGEEWSVEAERLQRLCNPPPPPPPKTQPAKAELSDRDRVLAVITSEPASVAEIRRQSGVKLVRKVLKGLVRRELVIKTRLGRYKLPKKNPKNSQEIRARRRPGKR